MAAGHGEIALGGSSCGRLQYPQRIIFLLAVLEYVNPGGADIKKSLTEYVRRPPRKSNVEEVLEEIQA